MTNNTLLKKLGYSDNDRLVIIHIDDVGMCQASIKAFHQLWDFGTISSGAVMVPCPWFPAVAQMCRENPTMDMGIHATLNSEWGGYRWGPVSTRERSSGLIDEAGYFHQTSEAVTRNARPAAVEAEVNAQVEMALSAGIDVTHIDAHMFTILNLAFIQSYIQAASSRRLPNMLPRTDAKGIEMLGFGPEMLKTYEPIMRQLEDGGVPMLDGIFEMPLDHDHDHIEIARTLLSELPAGITHFLFHPAIDTPELRASCPDWSARVANYKAFMSDELKVFIEQGDFKMIGYRQIRDAIRS